MCGTPQRSRRISTGLRRPATATSSARRTGAIRIAAKTARPRIYLLSDFDGLAAGALDGVSALLDVSDLLEDSDLPDDSDLPEDSDLVEDSDPLAPSLLPSPFEESALRLLFPLP